MKRFIIFTLVVAMLMPVTAFAEGFKPVQEYDDVFTDVSEADWFYDGVAGAYSYGFTQGSGEGKYSPYGLVSLAEVITFACRLNLTHSGKTASLDAGENEAWYKPWVEYAESSYIIQKDEFSGRYEKPATRAQVAYILGNALPFTVFENINTDISGIPDMLNTQEYYNEVIMLYRAGVLTGKDSRGNFAPTENITRGEIATVLYRIADETARIKVESTSSPGETVQGSVYNAEQVSEMYSESVFLIGVYNSRDELFATGSGFFIDGDGTAITNYHVIEDAASAKVLTIDGETHEVELLLGCDKEKDIAIIKVKGDGFKAAKVGDSSAVRNGQEIFCIGSPIGLDNTISEGLVSNSSREIEGHTYIQISAPISSGSSGGAVFNNKAEIIGITSAGASEGQNINLAIPINDIFTVERNINKTLAEYFGKVQNASGTAVSSDVFYKGTSLPMYEYITGRDCLDVREDDTSIIYAYEYNQIEFMLYLSLLGSLGWKAVKREDEGSLTMITVANASGTEMAVTAYDFVERHVLIGVFK